MVTLFEQQQQRIGHRGHATAQQHGIIRPFQRGQLGFHRAHRRVAIAPILLAFDLIPKHVLFKIVDQIRGLVKGIDRSLHNRHGEAVVGTETPFTGMNRLRGIG